MKYHHPLENPSLAPYGFVFPNRRKRLEFRTSPDLFWVNEEHLLARLWDRVNRSNAPKPLPVKTILHDLLPGFGTKWRITAGDFMHNGLPYLTRDILVLSSTLQWLGTNVGRCFLERDISGASETKLVPPFTIGPDNHEPWHVVRGKPKTGTFKRYHPSREFLIKLKTDSAFHRLDLVGFFVHECSSLCSLQGHYYRKKDATARDQAVIHGLMYWLGMDAGRAFLATFTKRKKSAWAHIQHLRQKERESRQPAA